MNKVYKCGHCGYIGPCYGTPVIGGSNSRVSAPWCAQCQMNDKLEFYTINNEQEGKNNKSN